MICLKMEYLKGSYVSLPSRGLSYVYCYVSKFMVWQEKVSVPSRGLSYLNRKEKRKQRKKSRVSVPSRGLSYLNRAKCHGGLSGRISFRPLTGTLLSKYCPISFVSDSEAWVSVPSRGLSYLNAIG